MLRHTGQVLLILLHVVGITVAQNCDEPNTAVIVVASVFGTLAVVFIILGIIGLLVWKRRRDISRPPESPFKKNNLQEVREDNSPDGGLSNPAFSDAEISLTEEGVSYVSCREYSSPEKKKISNAGKEQNTSKKTWTSLPTGDIPPGLVRNGSVGSLDNHLQFMDPEVTSVWLQSQDFIGLGFNIAGSMRDGIFVSQVHNRGPAVESGKFKIGDRILSVTISFENMVYEDALTILSYASPYPVKVTLQKEKQIKDRRISNTNLRLTHPLYRSQSVDTLLNINREPLSSPAKRSYSEVRPVSRSELLPVKKISTATLQLKTVHSSPINGMENHSINRREVTPSEIQIHTEVFHVENESSDNIDGSEIKVSKAKLKLRNSANVNQQVNTEESSSPQLPVNPVPEPIVVIRRSDDRREKDQAAPSHEFNVFDELNEEDKLDVLRLSYEDPDTSKDSPNDSVVVMPTEASTTELAPLPKLQLKLDSISNSDYVNVEPRSPPPTKPERRKKKGSSDNSESSPDAGTPLSEDGHFPLEQEAILAAAISSLETEPEIDEDSIVPQKCERKVITGSQNIELTQINKTSIQTNYVTVPDLSESNNSDTTEVGHNTLVDYSLSDMDSTLRPHTPDTSPPVEEEIITPLQKKHKPLDNLSEYLEQRHQKPTDNDSLLPSEKKDTQQEKDTVIELDKDVTAFDFNINMDSNPNLFSTPFPNRNTKETKTGVSYDISVVELHAMENEVKKNLMTNNKQGKKGGMVFEVRDNLISGVPMNIDNKSSSIPRVLSYHENQTQGDITIQKLRGGSLKDDSRPKSVTDTRSDSMDWSGKRLVRSGSFTDIPQNDSVSDWTDQIRGEDEDSTLVFQDTNTSSEESIINQFEKPGLSRANLFKARENLANLSDNSDSVVTTESSKSSSRNSTPPPPYTANGENEIVPSPDTTPTKTPLNVLSNINMSAPTISTDQENNEVINTTSTKFEGNGPITVSVNTPEQEDDTDC